MSRLLMIHCAVRKAKTCVSLQRPVLISRRRPPGWSPLRNISRVDANLLAADPPTTVAPPTTTLPPTTAAVKETSSEEDSTSFQASSAPASDSPFHCPSKPWKVFKMEKAAPTEAAPEEQDGTFSDSDLLAWRSRSQVTLLSFVSLSEESIFICGFSIPAEKC